MKLTREVSGSIAKELAMVFGDSRTQKILGVDGARYRAFCEDRACLTVEQLERITARTGRAWERWAVDAGGRGVKTAEGRAFVAEAHAMWDKILGPEKRSPVRSSPRRTKTSVLRQAI